MWLCVAMYNQLFFNIFSCQQFLPFWLVKFFFGVFSDFGKIIIRIIIIIVVIIINNNKKISNIKSFFVVKQLCLFVISCAFWYFHLEDFENLSFLKVNWFYWILGNRKFIDSKFYGYQETQKKQNLIPDEYLYFYSINISCLKKLWSSLLYRMMGKPIKNFLITIDSKIFIDLIGQIVGFCKHHLVGSVNTTWWRNLIIIHPPHSSHFKTVILT